MMIEVESTNLTNEPGSQTPQNQGMALDDARRVKTLSPGQLVLKRFFRNKLAVIGLVILTVMFLFSFLGPLLSPYSQTQIFHKRDTAQKDFAGAIVNTELRYSVKDGETFGSAERSRFLLAKGKGITVFESGNRSFSYVEEGDDFYRIFQLEPFAESLLGDITMAEGKTMPSGFEAALLKAEKAGDSQFKLDNVHYVLTRQGKKSVISTETDIAVASLDILDAVRAEDSRLVSSFDFRLASGSAEAKGDKSFTLDGKKYQLQEEEGAVVIYDPDGDPVAEITNIVINPLDPKDFLTVEFKALVREAIASRHNYFQYTDPNGVTVEYNVQRVNANIYIRRPVQVTLIDIFAAPSDQHLLGTDNAGMDTLTRLMYGGRVSLMVGFVTVLLELVIGVIFGGISGYFGGSVDTFMMRFVDLFNSIPTWPILLMLASVMDTLEVGPYQRMFILMAVLGILGWTGIARMVRGQILTLREQDFMVAAEATGIPTRRKIFRHLVPNVMPILIVSATGSLGGLIILEATLGFLGLGIKYPMASWGSIINLAQDAYVMANYWWIWLPAGLMIMSTVLGFNFVGDGLRDAFDPRMRR